MTSWCYYLIQTQIQNLLEVESVAVVIAKRSLQVYGYACRRDKAQDKKRASKIKVETREIEKDLNIDK